ncbi:MAG: hypothetical protein NTU49_01340, partial [Gammaproteobacteria bacterium]|nr:hypothetical protein [Gammaproteobacteria bacterium]
MRFFNIFLSATGLLIIQSVAYATDCTNPQGPGPVITCAAAVFNMTAEDFWNKKLFHPTTLDGFCVKNALPAGSSTSQATMYNTLACPNERGSYFSYNKFIAADAAILAAVGANNYKFMRSNSYALNLTELANFLATAAQETTGNGILPKSYEQDGLYFRYEDSFLSGTSCYNYPANPNWTGTGQTIGTGCSTLALANYYTNYYPLSTYIVAVKDG